MSVETRVCQNCKVSFVIEPEDFAFYDKMKVPPRNFQTAYAPERREIIYCEECYQAEVV